MDKLIDIWLKVFSSGRTYWSILWFIIIYLLFFPERAEKLSALIFKALRWISSFFDKKYIKHDIQSSVNDFSKKLSKKVYWLSPMKVRVNFIDENDVDDVFLKDWKYILRVKKSLNPNKNFVNTSMLFISKHLLSKVKRQISEKQKQSIDLFVAHKLFLEEKEEIVSQFVDDFLQPQTGDQKILEFFNKYDSIDQASLFFPIFLQEMIFLGERVFANPSSSRVKEEVSNLINFLNNYSTRVVGDSKENIFTWDYCKFGLVIVWCWRKVEHKWEDPYLLYIKSLMSENIESIYLIWNEHKENFIRSVCPKEFLDQSGYFLFKNEKYDSSLKHKDGRYEKVKTYLLVLRKKSINPYIKNK